MSNTGGLAGQLKLFDFNNCCFIIRNMHGQSVAKIYYDDGDAVRRNAADLMTKDEALEVAVKIARLQGYGKPSQLTRDPSSRADRASKTT